MSSAAQEKNDAPSAPSHVRHFVVAMLCMAALVAYVQRNSISVAEEAIRRELDLSKYQMGWIISCFFLTYAIFQIPTGFIGQVYGTRRALAMFVALFSAAAGLFALAFNPWMLIAARLGMGGLQAGIFPCAVDTVSKWIPDNRRSFSTGMLASFMSIGGAVGSILTGFLLTNIGWRMAYVIYSVPGFIFAAWLYWWFRDRPEEHKSVNRAEVELIRGVEPVTDKPTELETSPDEPREPTPWIAILTSVPILALCAQQVFRAAGYMFFASWFATYLRETRELEGWLVGLLTSLPLWAVVIGSPMGGLTSDWVLERTGNRRLSRQGVAAAAMLACAVLVCVSYPVANPWIAVLLISLGSFFSAFGGPCAYTATIDMGGKHLHMVFSTMNMAGNIGAFIFPIVVPWLLSENELYVNRMQVVQVVSEGDSPQEIVVEAERFIGNEKNEDGTRKDGKKRDRREIGKFGESDDAVIRFHHGMRSERTLFTEYDVNAPSSGEYMISVHHTGRDSPPLHLIVNTEQVSDDLLRQTPDEPDDASLHWSPKTIISLKKGTNVIRLETRTAASGNWDLVLFVFAGFYFAAFVCWLFVNTNTTVASKPK